MEASRLLPLLFFQNWKAERKKVHFYSKLIQSSESFLPQEQLSEFFEESLMGCSPHTFICFLFISFIFMLPCAATNTLYPTQSITDGQKLVSTNNMFELVFFSPGESLNRYLGIRFGEIQQVWIANRENPVTITSGIFTIQDNGNLAVLAESKYVVWSTNVSTASNATIAVLLDNGNLVLKEGNSSANSGRVVWQSFDHPSNVLLPGMKIGMNLKTGENRMLKSWKDDSDPAPGNFAFGIDPDGLKQFFIWRRSVPYWRAVFWNGSGYDVMGNKYDSHVVPVNFSIFSNQDEVYFTNDSPTPKSTIKLLVMDAYGILHSMEAENQSSTSVEWLGTKDECSIIGGCGQFSSCNVNNRPVCKCLPGFEPNSKDPSTGCHRKTRYECGEEDGLLSLKRVEVPPPTWSVGTNDADECRKWCLSSDCNCRGTGFTVNGSSCYLWESKDFQDVREEDEEGQEGLLMDVYIRMSASDLKLIGRQCNYCGTNIIPYPLSTSPDCGDPDYGALICDASNGRLRFRSLNGTYAITSINPDTRTLVIKPEGIDICWARSANRSDIHLNSNQHFHVTGNNTILLFNCSTTEQSPLNCNSSSACYRYIREGRAPCFDLERCCSYIAGEMSNMVGVLNTGCNAYASIVNYNFSLPAYDWWEGVEIKWDAPLEPVCIVPEDCDAWPNSKCLPDKSMAERKRCFCNNKFHWDSLAMNCIPGNDNGKRPLLMIISITVVVCTLLSGTLVYCFWSKISKKKGDPRTSETLDVIMFGENGRKDVHVPFFDFEGILDATENFSESNKLGRGGFGPVYKGKFPGEQELAVKRLSTSSRQGQEEFKNEVVLIAKLQHRNLVRLLGYCIKGDERILLYEYMPNKSLDYLLFDQNRCQLLNWEKRYHIILGIARGLLYLHEDSRLRIIHRDLKTSNILLDEEMKPKISDFGLARIFGGNQIQENTNRVAGTYGYMSPEYAVHGLFSVKSDVFSFGVILLEIVSGMKNTLFHHPEQSLSLLGHAWQLWQEGKWMDLLDKNLHEAHDVCEVQMCIHIGLLCVQENTIDRPTMASVVAMFVHEAVTLQTPKEPAFIMRSLPNQVFSSDTRNDITFSTVEGR